MKLQFIVLIVLIIFYSCTSTVRMHKDFKEEKNTINKVTVLPPRFEYFERGATMNESKPEYLPEINENIIEAINVILSSANFDVVPNDLNEEVLSQNQEMALILTRSYDEYIKLIEKIEDSSEEDLSVSLNPEIGIFADYTGADYLIFVVGNGYTSSEGAQVKDVGLSCLTGFLFGYSQYHQWSGMQVYIAVVNANSSEIIWFNNNTPSTSDYDPLNSQDILDLFDRLLKEGMIDMP